MSEEILVREFGVVVRRLRLAQGFSQEAFAERCSLHQTYIGSIERGEKVVTIVTAHKLAKALGITLSAMFMELEQDSGDLGSS